MNKVQNQNKKVLEEMLEGFNSDAVKTTLRSLRNFRIALSCFQVFEKLLATPL